MKKAENNVYKIGAMHPETRLRNWFRLLHDDFLVKRVPLTRRGYGIKRYLDEFNITCRTDAKGIYIIQKGVTVYKCNKRTDFDAKEAYASLF